MCEKNCVKNSIFSYLGFVNYSVLLYQYVNRSICAKHDNSSHLHAVIYSNILDFFQCYTHNNLGWKIHVVEPGYIAAHSGDKAGNVSNARRKAMPYVALATICLLTVSVITLHNRGRVF